ncbi:MAG: hypothetical protein HY758_07545, partial [Nitrospirae bacterium]|nr:hypothetical protein [Nitrospirota bacterium]
MNIFIPAFTAYGIFHCYLFLKIWSVFSMDPGSGIFLGVFFFFMTLSPLFIHLYSSRGSHRLARVYAYIGYIWMALVLFFVVTSLPVDTYNIGVRLAGSVSGKD